VGRGGGLLVNCVFYMLGLAYLISFVVVYINVLHCATSWKVAGSIPGVTGIFR
jgi:hypothetical protein